MVIYGADYIDEHCPCGGGGAFLGLVGVGLMTWSLWDSVKLAVKTMETTSRHFLCL